MLTIVVLVLLGLSRAVQPGTPRGQRAGTILYHLAPSDRLGRHEKEGVTSFIQGSVRCGAELPAYRFSAIPAALIGLLASSTVTRRTSYGTAPHSSTHTSCGRRYTAYATRRQVTQPADDIVQPWCNLHTPAIISRCVRSRFRPLHLYGSGRHCITNVFSQNISEIFQTFCQGFD